MRVSHRRRTLLGMHHDFEWDDPDQEPQLGEALISL
jgi:hypothetical protein